MKTETTRDVTLTITLNEDEALKLYNGLDRGPKDVNYEYYQNHLRSIGLIDKLKEFLGK